MAPIPGGDIEFGDGLYQSDRTPNPHLFELRKVYSPIQFGGFDASTGSLIVINRHDFVDLSGYDFGYEVLEDGVAIASGDLPALHTPARSRETVAVVLPTVPRRPGAEYVLTVTARAKAGAIPAIEAGTVIGWEQFVLGRQAVGAPAPAGQAARSDAGGLIRLSAGGAELVIDRASGLVLGYSIGGRLLLHGGAPNFYRALTDNDIGTGVESTHRIWNTASVSRTVLGVDVRAQGSRGAEVTVRYQWVAAPRASSPATI